LTKKELIRALEESISTSGVYFLNSAESGRALDVFADAFMEDPMLTWVGHLDDGDPHKETKMLRLIRCMMGWVNHRIINGSRGVTLGVRGRTNELVGAMALKPSSTARDGLLDILVPLFHHGPPPMYGKTKSDYGEYAAKRCDALGVLPKARERLMKGVDRWIYLQTIGVERSQHGQGYGKKMMKLLVQTADNMNVPVYLETESEDLEGMYHRYGFQTMERLPISVPGDDSPTSTLIMYLMRKEPRSGDANVGTIDPA